MMTKNLLRFSWIIIFLVNHINVHSAASSFGKCPQKVMDVELCRGQADQCQSDSDCSGESLCCSTGCNRACVLPSLTACDHSRYFFEKQRNLLRPEDANTIHVPNCTQSGAFEEIQCNEESGLCWCVDEFGFERGGTRENSREAVNCTRTNNRCSGPQCRMLCPYGFELDEEGCEICACRDICKGVKCPGALECQLQEVSCSLEPCPPVPTCKKARSWESLCPIGVPFTIPQNGDPYLCGTTPGKPTCPAGFECHVSPGHDYGICCGSETFYEKPGLCPTISSAKPCDESDEDSCQSACKHDLECPEMKKCCMTESRGKQCSDALNSTLCLQQKKIAEILSTKEIEGRGYIPQCDPISGSFRTKQCSRNGKICWCVDSALGRNLPQSLGPAEFINCNDSRGRDLTKPPPLAEACDIHLCGNTCEFGYKTDEVSGCGTCDCNEDPCHHLNCPKGSKCTFKSSESEPTCVQNSLRVNPCHNGTPLFDHASKELVICSENGSTCPSSHVCVKATVNTDGLCCLNLPRVEPTKPGMCPFISASLCNNGSLEIDSDNKQCNSDKDCEESMKCCGLPCGSICADPLLDAQTENGNLPTMCQYLKNIEMNQAEVLKNFKVGIHLPKCKRNGDFEEIQCNEKSCFCVDEFGIEIDSTRIPKPENNLTNEICLEKRRLPTCLDMTCRLGCDYGYKTKDGCRICECVNPCEENSVCDQDQVCEMVDTDCIEGHCPAVPYCIPRVYAAISLLQQTGETLGICPYGAPYFDGELNATLTCQPRARMLQCPDDYFCHEMDDSHDFGLCCPALEFSEESDTVGKTRIRVPILSSDNILEDFPIHREANCEQARERQMELLLEDNRVNYIPRCSPITGDWEPIQCIEEVNMCWCVNSLGKRISGSLTTGKPICNARQSRGKFLGSQSKFDQANICAEGEPIHVCNKSLCENKICMAYPDASCEIDPCGGCRIKFYDQNQNVVDCEAGLGKCHKEAQRIINSKVWINQQKQSEARIEEEFPDSMDRIIEDVLQERIGRSFAEPGSFEFPTVADLVAEVMKQSSIEQFGDQISKFFLRSGHNPDPTSGFNVPRPEKKMLETSSEDSLVVNPISNSVPLMMRKDSCPPPALNEILFRLSGTCVDSCNYDHECQADERCCLVNCGYRCQKVAVEFQVQIVEQFKGGSELEGILGDEANEDESSMLLNPPLCKSNGEYVSQQSQGELMWCVDSEGNPNPETFTRGVVLCSENGQIIENRATGEVCPKSGNPPMICTDECLRNTCAAHPNAICVADPCDFCKVSFFTPAGEKVLCVDKCQQEMDTGICRASVQRFFYNTTSNQCEDFQWGGCQGNENNFKTLKECQRSCEDEVDACSLPVSTGNCEEKMERWYFNTEIDSCQKYLGCDGVGGNNFPTRRHCESHCPNRVLCPNIVDGSLSVCSRKEACQNVTRACAGLFSDDYVCNVEPCSCTAELVHMDGQKVRCEAVTESVVRDLKEPITQSTEANVVPAKTNLDEFYLRMFQDAPSSRNPKELFIPSTGADLLQVKPELWDIPTRCLSMKEKYMTKCYENGDFVPTQCSLDEPVCWCVDSIGNQVEGTTTFRAGSKTCPIVSIQTVDVRISFPISSRDDVSSSQLGTEIQDLLRSLNAELTESKVSIDQSSDSIIRVEFILEGPSAGHISYILEEGLRRNLLGISLKNEFIPADSSTTRFHYVVPDIPAGNLYEFNTSFEDESDPTTEEVELRPDSVKSDDSVTAEILAVDGDLNIVAIVLTVIAAITAVLIIIGLVLGLQNKKKVQNHSKHNKFEWMPFTSPFGLESKSSGEMKGKI